MTVALRDDAPDLRGRATMGQHGGMRPLSFLLVVALLMPLPAGASGAPAKSRVAEDEPAPSADDPQRSEDDGEPKADAPPRKRKRTVPVPSPTQRGLPVRGGTEPRLREAEPEPPREKQRAEENVDDGDDRRREEAIERRRQRRRTGERRPRRDAAPPEAPKPPPQSPPPAPSASGSCGCCAAPCCGPNPLGCSRCGPRCLTFGLVGAAAGLLLGGSAGFVLGYVAAPGSASVQQRAEGGLLLGFVGGVGGAVALGLGGAMVGSAMTMALGE